MPQTTKTPRDSFKNPRWMRITLLAAAAVSILLGVAIIFFTNAFFRWAEMSLPLYPQIWWCLGMTIAFYGVGYAIAAQAPTRHWPIVFIGLLSNSCIPIALLWAATGDQLPLPLTVALIANAVIWIVPFALILRAAFIAWRLEDDRLVYEEVAQVLLETIRTNGGETLAEMSHQSPVLMAFLRHTGCPFCREAAADLARERVMLQTLGVQLALVHMGDERVGERFFGAYGLANVPRVSDPERTLYRAFKLRRGRLQQLFGIRVWRRAVSAALRGHWPGLLRGNSFQMPGLFLIRNGEIVRTFRYETAADRPDYAEFVCGLNVSEASDAAVCA